MPTLAYAQVTLRGSENTLAITLSPSNPTPGQVVRLGVQSPYIDLKKSAFTWYADGKVIAEGSGVSSAQITAKEVGGSTDILVEVTTDDVTMRAQARVAPMRVDLLIGSETYVPPFYRGRTVSISGSTVRAEARAYLFSENGSEIPPSEIVYTWRRDGQLIAGASGKGRSSLIIPTGFGISRIAVEAATLDGAISGVASQAIQQREPVVQLYQDHPLFGVTYFNALSQNAFVPDAEMRFAAVPYFAPARTADDPSLSYRWSVGGSSIPADPLDKNKITINAKDSVGMALVEVAITHRTNYLFDARGAWNITFSSSASSADDSFHQTQ